MVRELTESRGDQSHNFALLSFLPQVAKDALEPFVDIIYSYATKFGVIPKVGTAATGTMLDKTTTYDRQK